MNDINKQLIDFISASPSAYHAVENVRRELDAAGYTELFEGDDWSVTAPGKYYVRRNGSSIIALRLPKPDFRGFIVMAAHSDSPSFKIKWNSDVKAAGMYTMLNVEKYGGMLCSTWFDRPLSVAGRAIVAEGGRMVSRLVNVDRDLAVIPNVAIHMDRSANDGKSYISKTIELKFIPDKVSFTQYFTVLLKSPDYLLKFWNSVILTAPIVFAQLMVASIAAYGFTRWRGKVRDSLFFFYVILMLMPYQVTLVPNYLVSDWLHLLNTRWAIFLPGAFAPFSVFLLTKFMRRIPMAVIESAKIDGANEWHIFWNICLPQCRSALYSIAILVFIDNWNMVEQPLILLNDVEKQPLSMFLSSINAGEIGIAFAAAVIYMIPGLLLFLHGEAYLVEGIAHSGSVKG